MAFDLIALRKSLGLNQADMAEAMGLGSRAYFEIEANPEKIKPRHRILAEAVALSIADERNDPMLATRQQRAMILRLAELIKGA